MEARIKKATLKEAVTNIRMACDAVKPNQRTPYFFLVGAGVSFPPIPLASKLVERFKDRATRYGKAAELTSQQAVDEYSYWFAQAYPDRIDRQQFLRDEMKGQIISQANLRLAHLLLSRKISNLVITPNFDDFLTRALQLFGNQHIICDHPLTLDRIDVEQGDDIQIIHVHGSYWFYDCVNLTGEMDKRATEGAYQTMSSLLEQILNRRSPIVIGYSGWEGDLIMKALKKRLSVPSLPRTIYWFCYRKENIDLLPDWLKLHEAVVFVVPPEDSAGRLSAEQTESEPTSSSRGNRPSPTEAKKITEAGAGASTLAAQLVLEALINEFRLQAPELTTDPLGFLVKQLKVSLFKPDLLGGESDIYFINSVIDRIERARQWEIEELAEMQEIEAWIERIRDAVRRSQYAEAIAQATAFPGDDQKELTDTQLREVIDAVCSAALGLSQNSEDKIKGFDQVVELADILSEKGAGDSALVEKVAASLFNKGAALGEMGRQAEAIAAYDELIARYSNAAEEEVRTRAARALFNKGALLNEQGKQEEAIATYDEVVRRFGDAAEPALREQVARALVNKGVMLGDMGRSKEELAVYDEVVARYGDATESALREHVAIAMFNKGVVFDGLNRHDEAVAAYDEMLRWVGETQEPIFLEHVADALFNKAIVLAGLKRDEEALAVYDEVIARFGEATEHVASALVNKGIRLDGQGKQEEAIVTYDEVVRRFGDSTELAIREQAAWASVNKAVSLNKLGRREEAIVTCDEVVARYGDATEPVLREQVAKALVNKGIMLGDQGKGEEAIATHDEVIRRFGNATDPAVSSQVANALNGVSFENLCRAKRSWATGDEASAKALLAKALEQIESAHERQPADPIILGNLGYTLFLLGKKDEAHAALTKAIALGGEELRQGELNDSNIHPLPQDEEFRELVRSIPVPAAKE